MEWATKYSEINQFGAYKTPINSHHTAGGRSGFGRLVASANTTGINWLWSLQLFGGKSSPQKIHSKYRSQSLDRQNHHSIFVIRFWFLSCTIPSPICHGRNSMPYVGLLHLSEVHSLQWALWAPYSWLDDLFYPNIQSPRPQGPKWTKTPVPSSSSFISNMMADQSFKRWCLSKKIPWLIITSSNWPPNWVVNPRLW